MKGALIVFPILIRVRKDFYEPEKEPTLPAFPYIANDWIMQLKIALSKRVRSLPSGRAK